MNEGREAFRQRLAQLRKEYQILLPERIEEVRRACAEVLASDGAAAQLTALYQLVHNLAGSGATFGYHEISETARRFERFIQSLITASSGLTETQRDQLHAHRVLLEAASAPAESSRESSAGWDHRLEPSKFPVPAGSEKLIFLVDDDRDLAIHLDYALRQFGYTVRLFPELQGLSEALAQTLPLAILMDLAFPEGDLAGAETIRAINAEREEPIPVIFISVRDDLDARLHAVLAGNTHYLTKPLDIPALVRTLDEVVLARPPEPYRILIVDDDAELAAFYQIHLEQAGMTVSVMTDPREALAAIPQTRAELVLMDVHMPFCSGLELAAVIRQCEGYTGLAIVFLSTESNIDRQLAAMHLGGDDFLTKPIEPWHLVRSVQARVKRARDLRLGKERLASQALRQGEERFRLAIESAPCGMVMVDRAGHIVLVNAQAETLFGYTRAELIGQPVELLVPERSRDRHRIDLNHFFNDPKPRSMAIGREIHGCHKDGREIPVEVGLSLLQTEEGPLVLSTIVDITERKQAEAAVTALKDKLAADLVNMTQLHALSARMVQTGDLATLLKEIIDAAIMMTKADMGNIQLLDRESGVLKIVAQRGFEAPFLEFFNAVHDGRAACGTALQRGERVIIEDVAASPVFAGTSALDVMLEANARAVQSTPLFSRSGSLVGMLSTHYHRPHRPAEQDLCLLDLLARQAADFIERTQAEEALRESESRFQRMADSAPVLIWIAGTDKQCTYFNKPWLDFTGQAMEQELGYGWAEDVHPDDRDPCLEIYTREFDAHRHFTLEYRLRHHDGEYRWVLDRGIPLYGPGEEFAGYIGSCLDITERKHMEEALKMADRRKDEFLAMLAHELRNPLAAIRNAIAVIQLLNSAEPKLLWAREALDRQVHHLTRLVNDLLDVSRLTRGVITLHKEPIELAAVVQQAVEVSRPLIEARSHQLWVSLPSEPIRLEGDLVRLVQVLLNLLNNAAKYTHEGGQIWYEAKRVGSEVAVSVRDNGIGIPAALLPHIFDLFIQAERSLDRSQGGLGIGLTLVRRLVEMHGGRVEARSEGPDQGAEFTVWLPVLVEPIHAEVEGGEQEPSCPLRGVCILLVEDDPVVAESMRMLLDLQGYEVRTVHTGKAALDVARTFRPEIILLDIGLPEMDGYEVARRLRAQAETENVSLVALTGYGQDEDRAKSKAAGFDTHLVKPVNLATLNETLCSLLNQTAGKDYGASRVGQ